MIFYLPMALGSLAALALAADDDLGGFWRLVATALGASALAFQWQPSLRDQVHWIIPLFEQVFLVIWISIYKRND